MRIAAALFVAAHGIGYSVWFMSAWAPATLGGPEKTMAVVDAPASGGAGKAVGVLALVVVAGFLAAAFGIWQQTAWWPAALVATIAAAVPIGLLWNPVGNVSAMATLANIGLLAATLMSWGDRFLGAH